MEIHHFQWQGGVLHVWRGGTDLDGTILTIVEGVEHDVTGGTVVLLSGQTTSSGGADIAMTSGVPFYDLHIGTLNISDPPSPFNGDMGATNTRQQDLVILNDFFVNITGDFRLGRGANNNLDNQNYRLILSGNLTIRNGRFVPGTDTSSAADENDVIFNGAGTQLITGNGTDPVTFQDFEISGMSTVQIEVNTDLLVTGNWKLLSGGFDANGRQVTFTKTFDSDPSPAKNLLQSIDGLTTTFYDLEFDYADVSINLIDLAAPELNVINQLILTSGIFNLGDNQLNLLNSSTSTVAGTPSNTSMVIASGGASATGIVKTYSTVAPQSFTFPLGTGSLYTPATIDLTNTGGLPGTVRVFPINSVHPAAADPMTSLHYQWEVSTTGFGGSPGINHQFNYDDGAHVLGTEAIYKDAVFDGSSWTEGTTTNVDETNDIISVTTSSALADHIFTAGEDFMINAETFYSIATGNWSNGMIWSKTDNGPAAGEFPTVEDIVIIDDSDVITIQDGTMADATYVFIESGATLEAIEEDIRTFKPGQR